MRAATGDEGGGKGARRIMGAASTTAETASRRITDVFVSRARRKRRILSSSFPCLSAGDKSQINEIVRRAASKSTPLLTSASNRCCPIRAVSTQTMTCSLITVRTICSQETRHAAPLDHVRDGEPAMITTRRPSGTLRRIQSKQGERRRRTASMATHVRSCASRLGRDADRCRPLELKPARRRVLRLRPCTSQFGTSGALVEEAPDSRSNDGCRQERRGKQGLAQRQRYLS